MLRFALNNENESVAASQAIKQQDYFCAECHRIVRIRAGAERQSHFYHFEPNQNCRQSQKSEAHWQVQNYLQDLISPSLLHLERRFPQINRIADAVWENKKLIFEVQCSPITAQEVSERNRDYASLGYQVVWLFHDRRYNKRKVTAAEFFMRNNCHYYTNIDEQRKGWIYDQYDTIHKGRRQHRIKKMYVDLSQPKEYLEGTFLHRSDKPALIQRRLEANSKMYFCGDMIYRWLHQYENSNEWMTEALKIESEYLLTHSTFRNITNNSFIEKFRYYFIRPYRLIFQLLLEKACR